MPQAETGNGVLVVRSNDKVTAAASWEGNALPRARGCLSASGVTRSMHSSCVIVAGIFWLSVVLWALSADRLLMVTYQMYYVWYVKYGLDERSTIERDLLFYKFIFVMPGGPKPMERVICPFQDTPFPDPAR